MVLIVEVGKTIIEITGEAGLIIEVTIDEITLTTEMTVDNVEITVIIMEDRIKDLKKGRRGQNKYRGSGGASGGGNNNTTVSGRELHVSGESPVRKVAGAISWIAREGECPRILATQPPAINTACKAIAIARNYLREDNIDVSAYPRFSPNRRRTDDSFTFILAKAVKRAEKYQRGQTSDEDEQQMKISKNSKPPTVAGAISARVREGQRVVLACIGPECVAIAVRSIAIA
eukprot:UN23483